MTYETRRSRTYTVERAPWYPLEMVRAIVIVWLFAGLRSDEIYRLRVGTVRWQREEVVVQGSDETLAKDAICWLDIPINKTGTAFTKAVDRVVGEAIEVWERVRPSQPLALDPKTSERVHFLFFYRGKCMGVQYISARLIPMLCRKAGIPTSDARGNITSHRARSTIASQLFNAKEPLTLFELQEWLGHRNPDATRYYARKVTNYCEATFLLTRSRIEMVGLLSQRGYLRPDFWRALSARVQVSRLFQPENKDADSHHSNSDMARYWTLNG